MGWGEFEEFAIEGDVDFVRWSKSEMEGKYSA